ncbi:MAG: ribbon-helix-helix domain-containing protein [Isosphaeraceae bacterium]
MTIHLPAELEQFVREQVLAGRYDSEDAVVRQALEEFREHVPASTSGPGMTEAEFKQHLLHTGRVSSLPTPAPPGSRPVFSPIELEGEPLSETILRERR